MNFLFRPRPCGSTSSLIMRMILFGLYLFLMWQLGRCFISFLVKVFIFLCFGMLFIVSLFFEKFMNMQVLVLMNIGLVSFMSLVQFFGLCMFFFLMRVSFIIVFVWVLFISLRNFFIFFQLLGIMGMLMWLQVLRFGVVSEMQSWVGSLFFFFIFLSFLGRVLLVIMNVVKFFLWNFLMRLFIQG